MAEALVAEAEGLSRFDGDRRVWGPVHHWTIRAVLRRFRLPAPSGRARHSSANGLATE